MNLCPKKFRLMREYHEAKSKFSIAIAELYKMMQRAGQAEYEQLRQVEEAAYLAAMDAQEQLRRHIQEHGCET